MTRGSNAVAEAVIKVEDKEGNMLQVRATREDTDVASIEVTTKRIDECLTKSWRHEQEDVLVE